MKSTNFSRFSVLLLIMITALFTSCEVEDSADVNQDKIYTDYELFYNSNTDKTWVVVRFRFGGPTGTLLELKDPAAVTFDGELLPFNALFVGHYKEYAGQLSSGSFEYTNVDGEVFTNAVPTYEPIAFPNDLDSLSKSAAYSLIWDGTPLSANQGAGLFIGSWTWGEDALFIQTSEGANDIVMGTDQLSNVAIGPSIFYMDRQTEKQVDEGTGEGGLIRGKYRAKNKEVIIVD